LGTVTVTTADEDEDEDEDEDVIHLKRDENGELVGYFKVQQHGQRMLVSISIQYSASASACGRDTFQHGSVLLE